jgi:long-chain acyl-CoA synthetase
MTSDEKGRQSFLHPREDTFPKLLLRNCQRWGSDRVALRKKEDGVWKEHSWKDCCREVEALFQGLVGLGLVPGDRVSILGHNSPEWFWSELAVQAVRGAVVGLDPDSSAEETLQVLEESRSRFAIVQGQQQVDKMLEIQNRLRSLKRIVYWGTEVPQHYDNPALISLASVIELGQEHRESRHGYFEESLILGTGSDVAMLVYEPGTAASKALPVTYRLLLSSMEGDMASNTVSDGDEYVSLINPGCLFEQMVGFCAWLSAGQKQSFIKATEVVQKDLKDVSPQTVVYPAQQWQQLAATIQGDVLGGSWLKRSLFNRSLFAGPERADPLAEGGRPSTFGRLLRTIAELVVFRPLREKHGLDKARRTWAVGEQLPTETVEFFQAIGVTLKQSFCSTEDGIVKVRLADGSAGQRLAG